MLYSGTILLMNDSSHLHIHRLGPLTRAPITGPLCAYCVLGCSCLLASMCVFAICALGVYVFLSLAFLERSNLTPTVCTYKLGAVCVCVCSRRGFSTQFLTGCFFSLCSFNHFPPPVHHSMLHSALECHP